jgi:hypothetical protein
MAVKSEWSLGSGSDRRHLLTDGLGENSSRTWDPVSGQDRPSAPKNLPPDPEIAFNMGYQAGTAASKPDTFGKAFGTEMKALGGDIGTIIGREFRNEAAQAVDELLHVEPPLPKPKTPSKLKNAAKSAGRTAARTSEKVGKWAIKTGIEAFRAWQDKRRRSSTSPSSPITNNLLRPDGGDVIDGQWTVTDDD